MSPVQWTFAIGGLFGPAFVAWVMIRRGLRSKFPFFFNYMLLYVLISCLGLAAFFYSCTLFSYASWLLGTLLMITEVAVIYEVLASTLKSYSALSDLAKLLFRWAAVFLFFTALITALATNGQQATKLTAAFVVVERCIRLMQCGLLLFLLVFETRLGVSWRTHGMAIAIGLGTFAAIDLTVSYAWAQPWLSTAFLDALRGGAYVGALLLWGCFLMMREPASKSVLDSPSRLIFQRWNEALLASPLISRRGEVIAMTPVESFLPGVERTVERVMARKMMN